MNLLELSNGLTAAKWHFEIQFSGIVNTQTKTAWARWRRYFGFWTEIMFKFNFITEESDKDASKAEQAGELYEILAWKWGLTLFVLVAETKTEAETSTDSKAVNEHDECHEIFPSKEQSERDYFAPNLVATLNCITFHQHTVYHVPIDDIIDQLAEQFDDIGCAEKNHSDLIAGIYEGDAKNV